MSDEVPESPSTDEPSPARTDRGAWMWFAATAVVFGAALGGEFLNWGDQEWITANPLVTGSDRRAWLDIWTTSELGAYYPLYFTV